MKQPTHAVKYTFAVLLLAALTTTEILSATYAKYIISSGPVADSARVAVYDVTVTEGEGNKNSNLNNTGNTNLLDGDVNLDAAGDPDDPNDPKDSYDKNISGGTINNISSVAKTYKIVNKSEVAVSYKVVVTLANDLPSGTSYSISGSGFSQTGVTARESTFTNSAWALAPGAGDTGAHTITLTFTTDNTNNDAVTDLTGIGVTVKVVATQID